MSKLCCNWFGEIAGFKSIPCFKIALGSGSLGGRGPGPFLGVTVLSPPPWLSPGTRNSMLLFIFDWD
jgi:hypothetical protein